MSISAVVQAVLKMSGKKQNDLIGVLGVGTKQSLSNKFSHERWYANDLAKVAEVCGCKLAFVLPDGQKIVISADDKKDLDE